MPKLKLFCFNHELELIGKTYLAPRVTFKDDELTVYTLNLASENILVTGATQYLLKCKKCSALITKQLIGKEDV